MKKFLPLVLLFFYTVSYSQISSTFDTDADGWILRNDGDNVTATIVHNSTGGNPGGFISGTLAFDNYPAFFWYAPAKFLGNLTYQSYGQTLTFSQQQNVVGDNNEYNGNYYEAFSADIVIASGNNKIYYHLPKPTIAPDWSTYTINLDTSSPWRTSTAANAPLASSHQIKVALSNVTEISIRGNYNNSPNTVSLDHVVIGQRTLNTPPTISTISQLSGKPGSSVTISGTNFGSSIAENEVYFGAVAATLTSASPTSITATVPIGATYEKLTIINKTTGVSIQSDKPFNPTFDKGGRIIPASFKSKIDFLLDATAGNDLRGLTIADVDGDGWSDIIAAESSINSVSIFRNLGTGGELSTTSFADKVSIPGGGNGGGLRIMDLDGDGKRDIATEYATGSLTSFATFRNTSTPGNISFEPVELWAGLVYSGPLSAVEDVDGDGLFDLIGQHGSGSVFLDFWIAQNISIPGNIEFTNSVSYFGSSTLDAGAGVSTGDLDNDGIPEIIVKHGFGNQFQIIKNNSTPGNISLGTPFPITNPSSGNIVIADFNQDGKNDLVWKQGSANDDVHIRLNTYAGGLLSATDFETEIILNADLLNYGAVSVGDINGDGKPDILTSDSRQIGVFENIYSGGAFSSASFIRSHVFEASGISTYPTAMIPADLNGDLKPEIIVGITNTNPIRVLVYENRNVIAPVISLNTVSPLKGEVGSTVTITGTNFSTVPSENTVFFGATQATVLTASENELTVSVPSGATMSLVSVTRDNLTARYHLPFGPTFGPGVVFDNTHFSPPVTFTLTTADYDIAVGDLNRDGKPDVVAEGQTSRAYSFLNTHSNGTITTSSLIANDTTASSTQNPILVDIDEDGFLDILSTNGVYRNISSAGKVNFATLTSISIGSNLSMGDFNLDGKTEVLGANGTEVRLVENRSPQPGNFVTGSYPSFSNSFNYSKPGTGGGTAAADFDNDGWKDFVATNPNTDNVSVWRNNGEFRISTTEFTAQPVITVGDNPGRIYEGDLDVDGKMDLVLYHGTGSNPTMLTVLHNQSTVGNIAFTRFDFTLPGAATVAHISDLDGDGKPEIIVTSEATDQFFILKNTSTPGTIDAASFATPFVTAVNNPRGLSTGDLNADGKPEIIITSAPNSLLVFENLIPVGPTISISPQPVSVEVCDGETTSFTLTAIGADNLTYQWQKFDGSVFTNISNTGGYSGTTTATLTINTTGNFGAGDYRCEVKGDLAPDRFSNTATLTINAVPVAPTTTGASNCIPAAITLTASGGVNGQYRWYDSGGVLIPAQTNSTYTTPVINTTTNYSVAINNGFCESTKTSVTATIQPLTKPTLTASQPITNNAINICVGQSVTLSAPNGFPTYTWSNGASTQQITVNTTGVYSFTVTDAAGCVSPSSDPVNLTVNPFPTATITANGTQLSASSGDSYQWYHNGNAITNATGQTFEYNVLEYGVYYVDVTENGCTTTSDDFVYLITFVDETKNGLKVYPNPVVENLVVEFTPPYSIQVMGMAGNVIQTFQVQSKSKSLDFSSIAKGSYFLKIKNENHTQYLRIIKN